MATLARLTQLSNNSIRDTSTHNGDNRCHQKEPFMTLRAVSLSEQIADHLAEQIVRGERKPGEKLPEAELAKQLEVSTNSLREAFRLLEKQHLIELQPRRGARVCEVSES